jgi:uncharacterized protein (TIGR03067 family)
VRLRLLLALLALSGLTAFAPAPLPKPPRRGAVGPLDLKRLQGVWVVEKAERTTAGAYRVVKDPVTHILIEGDLWVFMQGKAKRSSEFRLVLPDPTRTPVWFTFRAKNQPAGGTDGLLTEEKDGRVRVLYNWGSPRPASFENPPAGYWALTLRREQAPAGPARTER